MNRLQVRSKIWLELDGEPFLGAGRERLLRLIHQHGSINAAAQELGLSYRKAWSQLKAMEEKLDLPMIARSKGGTGGGESTLTAAALDLLNRYDQLRCGINRHVDNKFMETFASCAAFDADNHPFDER
ncbi:MAG: LysR family transcriptional regulator [Desulfuromonadales bacterium]|nr:LysR family transcriptional regulator [Desulfuromonadales bacterium]